MKNNIFILIIILSCTLSACKNTQKSPEENVTVIPVKTFNAEFRSFHESVHTAGKLSSREELKLSFKTGGIVSAIPVKEGAFVKKGTILAKLNLAEIEAGVKQAKLAADKAYRDLVRVKNLYKDSVATLEQYQNARTAYDYSKAQKAIADFNLQYSVIKAPSDGRVLKILTGVNEMIAPGYPALLFASSSEEWVVKAALTDKDVILVSEDDSAGVRMDAYPGTVFSAVLTDIAAMSDPYTGTYEAEILILSPLSGFRSGLIATADIVAGNADSLLWIPMVSLLDPVDDYGYVYVLENDRPVRKKVTTCGIYDDGVLLKEGLSENEQVVTEGAAMINAGTRIKIVN